MTSLFPHRLVAAEAEAGWHYAAWVAIDVRLFVFLLLISLLTAAGIAALVVKRKTFWDYAATFIVSFTGTLLLCLLIFNEVAQYPVFVVETVFAFP